MAQDHPSFVATFRPTEAIPEDDPLGEAFHVNRKITARASTQGLRWTVEVTEEGTGLEILKVPATEQPLVELHRRLTKQLRGDHFVVTLRTDVQVRELSRTGKERGGSGRSSRR